MEFNLLGRNVKMTRKVLIKFIMVLVLYILFLFWVKSWMGIIVIPFIIDNYTTKFIPWGWWKKSNNTFSKKIMSFFYQIRKSFSDIGKMPLIIRKEKFILRVQDGYFYCGGTDVDSQIDCLTHQRRTGTISSQ